MSVMTALSCRTDDSKTGSVLTGHRASTSTDRARLRGKAAPVARARRTRLWWQVRITRRRDRAACARAARGTARIGSL